MQQTFKNMQVIYQILQLFYNKLNLNCKENTQFLQQFLNKYTSKNLFLQGVSEQNLKNMMQKIHFYKEI